MVMMPAERIPPAPAAPPRFHRGSCLPVLKPWGAQRLLRCLNVNARGEAISFRPRSTAAWAAEDYQDEEEDGGFEAVRAKLMDHLREAAERVRLPSASGQEHEAAAAAAVPAEAETGTASADAARPWNLRARTAVRKVSRYGFEPDAAAAGNGDFAKPAPPRPRFSVSLSSREIAEDVYAVTGSLPRRRPRKRARAVQRQLDALFPGLWLEEITPESYKVSD